MAFLSDILYEIGSAVNMADEQNIIATIRAMVNACYEESKKQHKLLEGKPKDQLADIAIFDRINLTFKLTVNKLNKEGKDFVKTNGYEEFVKILSPDLYEMVFGKQREELNRELKKK